MKKIVKKLLNYFGINITRLRHNTLSTDVKYRAEITFWKEMLLKYNEWYDGKIASLYEEPCPNEDTKIVSLTKQYSALLTWIEVHQKTKYLEDLFLDKLAFDGLRILDIGSGPLPSGSGFLNCEVYCLDPLLPSYLEAGFPIHIYDKRVKFVNGYSENMPFCDNYFDAVISVNAIDHVDDFNLTVIEIKRVLKPGGKLRFHIHYHTKTATEPLELNDIIVSEAFSWDKNFRKIYESKRKRGSIVDDLAESYTVWSNFQ
jgi:SAM-dependent methyltransferase